MLRYKAPSQYQGRFSVADREFHGETIQAGFPVLDHHRRRQPRPARLRRPRPLRHRAHRAPLGITFGHGIHFCIGAHLARLEGKTAFNELYRRWPDLQVDQAGIKYVHMANVAGPSSVPVTVVS